MAYTLDFGIALGSVNTGLSLEAQLVDSAGNPVGVPITTGFTEIGDGNYLWHATAIPANHQGGVIFKNQAGGAVEAFTSINPQIEENVLLQESLDQLFIEAGVNARQAISIVAAVLAGVLQQQCPTGTVQISAINNSGITRVTAQTSNGSRTSVVLNLP
jgi:hypothetical protein